MGKSNDINLLKLVSEVNPEQVGGVLKEIEKYSETLTQISGIIARLNRIGVLPAIMRIAGKKFEIEGDINAPLQHPLQTIAASPTHKFLFDELNEQTEEVVKAFLHQSMQAQAQVKQPKKPKGKTKDKT